MKDPLLDGTIGALGEFGLIDEVVPLVSSPPQVLIGPGDDAALVEVATGQVLISTDLSVEGRHFRRDWAEPYDIGRKAAGANLADITAMGGTATALTVGLAAPADLEASWAVELSRGISDEAALVGAAVVGGDVTASDSVVTIAITVVGECADAVVLRSGAQPGDVVAAVGRIGWAGAGFHVLARGFRSPRAVVQAYRRPEPPYAAGPQAASAGATAMIDVSDGLLADVGHIAEASGVGIDIDAASFVIGEPLEAVGAALGTDPLSFVLTGGDDHTIVATFGARRDVPPGWIVIGAVSEGAGVTVGGTAWEGVAGHQHFR